MIMNPEEGPGEAAPSETSDEYLKAVTLGGPERLEGTIHLDPYDPTWPERFDELAGRIRRALGPKVLLLEHVGSTSVPGLAAKPVIDMVLAVADSADEAWYVPSLESEGFVLRIREPDWYQHRLLKTVEGDANLHVFSRGCEEIDRMLATWSAHAASDEAPRHRGASSMPRDLRP